MYYIIFIKYKLGESDKMLFLNEVIVEDNVLFETMFCLFFNCCKNAGGAKVKIMCCLFSECCKYAGGAKV